MGNVKTSAERVRQKSRERREQEKQDLRQAILTAAAELFLEQGYEHFSLRQVAERIGYSATTIYLYFRDKDELLFEVVDQGFDTFGQQLAAAAQSTDDPRQQLIELNHAYVAFALEHPMHYQLMFMQRADFLMGYKPGETTPRISAFDVAQNVVRQAIEAGVLRPGDPAAVFDVVWGTVHGIVALGLSMPFFDADRVRAAADLLIKMLFDGLGTNKNSR